MMRGTPSRMHRGSRPRRSAEPHRAARFVRPPRPRRWLERVSRFGLVVRGFIYFVPGVLAMEWAFGRHHQNMSQTGSIELVGKQPMGRALLIVVAIGLAGYAAWGVYRALFDAQARGHKPGGVVLRIGYATSAIAYAGMLLATVRLLTSAPAHAAAHADWSVAVLARPFGGIVVGIIGLCWIFGSGVSQIVMGWRRSFERDLVLERMGGAERRWAVGLGRVGLIARGLVFTIIGIMLVAAATHPRPASGTGLEGALLELSRQPFGLVLLAAAGAGLMAFGLFSALCARWMRMRPDGPGPLPPSSHPIGA